jgi:hypothetical protein
LVTMAAPPPLSVVFVAILGAVEGPKKQRSNSELAGEPQPHGN